MTVSTTCEAHYPALLDGQAVVCNRQAGHDGQHQQISAYGDIRAFDDQPECWEGVTRKVVIVLEVDGMFAPTWGAVRRILDRNMPADSLLTVAPLTGATGTITIRPSVGLSGSLTVTGPRA